MNNTTTYKDREITIRRVWRSHDRFAYKTKIDGQFAFLKSSRENALHNAKKWIDENAFCLNGEWTLPSDK
jgi:hypothetical protein